MPAPGSRRPRPRTSSLLLLLGALPACTGGADPRGGEPETVRVAVAASLRDPFGEIVAGFLARHAAQGWTVVPVHVASGAAYQQIVAGAPFDLLVSADTLVPAALERAGRTEEGTRRTYACGALALWFAAGEGDPTLARLAGPEVRRVAIASPETAPYGRGARETLARAGLDAAVTPKLVIGQDAGQAAQLALAGADAALLPLAVARSAPFAARGRHVVVPGTLHEPLEQAAVLVRGRASPAARALHAYLLSDEGAAVLRRHAYRIPATGATDRCGPGAA